MDNQETEIINKFEILFELLKEKENLKVRIIDENIFVKIRPINSHEYKTDFTEDDFYIYLTPFEFVGLKLGLFKLSEDLGGVVYDLEGV